MSTRILLVTGLGGAGRTTVAAATATARARGGDRVLLLTTDDDGPPDALGDGAARGRAPVVRHVDAAAHFRQEFLAFQEQAGGVLEFLGAAPLEEDELSEPPGARAVAVLHAVRAAREEGVWDHVVVDLPPAAEAVRLLALPEQARRWLTRLLPPERQAARALRPVLAQLAGVPMPAQRLFQAAERWERELAAVQEMLDDAATSVRVVADASPGATRRLRGIRAGLALHGHRLDSLVLNRALPADSADPFLAAAHEAREQAEAELRKEWPDLPVTVLPHLGRAPRDADDLTELLGGSTGDPVEPDGADPGAAGPRPDPWHVLDQRADDGLLVYRVPLPGAVRERLQLVRRGDELVVTVGPFRRIRPLPSALRRCSVAGAALRDGALLVRFAPAPGLWPSAD